jgi:hypothetical protein
MQWVLDDFPPSLLFPAGLAASGIDERGKVEEITH